MSAAVVMRLAYFSPLTPQRSGISDYSEELLPLLAQHADITLFVDGFQPMNRELTSRFEVCDYRKQPWLLDQLGRFDAVLYHMGNDHRYHTGIYEAMIKHPGILVLHDFSLHDFFLNLAHARSDLRVYLDELEACHGAAARREAANSLQFGLLPRIIANPIEFSLNARLARAAKGIIVHSQCNRRRLEEIAPGVPVITIAMHITAEAAQTEPGGWPSSNSARIASFGLITPEKGIERALRALSTLREQHDFRYLLVGAPSRYFNVRDLVREHGLQGRVEITGHVSLEEFQRHIAQTDIAINLRERTVGETSASLCRIMAAGVPAIVSNAGWFSELPNDAVVKVDVNGSTDALLKAYLQRLIVDRDLRTQIGANARGHVLAMNDINRSAEQYLSFISHVAATYVDRNLIASVTRELSTVGVDPNTDNEVLFEVATELALLTPNYSRQPVTSQAAVSSDFRPERSDKSPPPVHENGRLQKLEGIDYKRAAIEYPRKLDPERRHYLFTKPFYNLANKPPKHNGQGMDAETFRHFCDFANIAVALALPAGSRILDVGCGSGWLSEYFARLGYDVTGIDISPELIEMSRERLARVGYDVDHEVPLRAIFAVHDIEQSPLTEHFDAAICYDSLHHFENERAVIQNLASVITYGGVLFILEGDRPPAKSATETELLEVMHRYETLESPFDREYLRALLDGHGFAVVGDYVSVNGLFERDSMEGDRLRVTPPAVNYLLCKKVVAEPGRAAATVPDSRRPSLLRARFEALAPAPGQLAPGELLVVSVRIENAGDTLWLTDQNPRSGIVMPAVRVFDSQQTLVTEFHGEPLLPHAVAPGEKVNIKIEYNAPQRAGSYTLKLDLVDQQICWFEQQGSEPFSISFEVRSREP